MSGVMKGEIVRSQLACTLLLITKYTLIVVQILDAIYKSNFANFLCLITSIP